MTDGGGDSFFSSLGMKIADVAKVAPGTFIAGHEMDEEELSILSSPAYPVALPTGPIAEYAKARGVLSLQEADQEMHGYIRYVKQEDRAQVKRLHNLLSNDVPIYMKVGDIDGVSATGMLMAMQQMSNPATPDELLRQALGLDLYIAAQLEFGRQFLIAMREMEAQ